MNFQWERLWLLVEKPLRGFADDLVTLIARTRAIVRVGAVLGVLLLIAGLLRWHANWVNSAGIIFDICGALRLFVKEEWDELTDKYVEEYGDVEKYPFGPPSHVTRTIIDNEGFNADLGGDRGLGPHYFNNIGVLLLVVGFVLQLAANFM